jgi:hypothetical protein
MGVRISTYEEVDPVIFDLTRFTLNEISPALVSGLNQFKLLSKQFSEFNQRIAKNADITFISDRTLQQLQILNEASMDLSYQQTNAQVFELMSKCFNSVLGFDKMALIKFHEGVPMKLNESG